MIDLSGKVALVTGGASGIGLTLVEGLLDRGCAVIAGDIAFGDGIAALAARWHPRLVTVPMDVTSDMQVAEAVGQAETTFGRLDIVVNNAGLYTTITRAPFEDLSTEEWEKVFAVNVTGVFRTVKACLPLLRASRAGRVLNITSATFFSAPPNMLHYVATKGALTAMTRSLARELGGDSITVNAIAPGFTLSSGVMDAGIAQSTPQADRARNARAIRRDQLPNDLIGATCFLASDEAGFITGQTLVIDGGAVMH